jgi:hypothetical protein
MDKRELTDRLAAVLEDTVFRETDSYLWEEIESFLDTDELERFREGIASEFDCECPPTEELRFADLIDQLCADFRMEQK